METFGLQYCKSCRGYILLFANMAHPSLENISSDAFAVCIDFNFLIFVM